MGKKLEGKVVLITGGVKRVGAAIARRLHEAGANLVLHYRKSAADAAQLKAELETARPGSVALVAADLLETAQLPALAASAIRCFGQIDALVNNASSFYPTPLGDITEADWVDLIGSNLKAPLFLAQALAPELRMRGGAIVNITDIHAERPLAGYLVYSVAKAGLRGLTAGLARELAPQVRVNAVAPGAIQWPDDGQFDPAERDRIVAHAPLQRIGMPDDIAGAVYYLIADAPYVTGLTINVDGGRSIAL